MMDLSSKRVVVAKTNHIGDVAISLPMAGLVKRYYPQSHVIFLNRGVACDVASMSEDVDEVVDLNDLVQSHQGDMASALASLNADVFIHANPSPELSEAAMKAEIPLRIGSLYRRYHWRTCHKLAAISRAWGINKRRLDLQYLRPLGLPIPSSDGDIASLVHLRQLPLPAAIARQLDPQRCKIVIQPGAITASAHNWPVDRFAELLDRLDYDRFQVFISGSSEEHIKFGRLCESFPVEDWLGTFDLRTFYQVLGWVDGMIAGSTGPLHLAATYPQLRLLGLYRWQPAYRRRWHPLGQHTTLLSHPLGTSHISVDRVLNVLSYW